MKTRTVNTLYLVGKNFIEIRHNAFISILHNVNIERKLKIQ